MVTNLQLFREANSLSVEDFGVITGLNAGAIVLVEAGIPPSATTGKILERYFCSAWLAAAVGRPFECATLHCLGIAPRVELGRLPYRDP